MIILVPLLILVVLAAVAIFGLSWFIASKLLMRKSNTPATNITVIDVMPQTITLTSNKNTQRDGQFGLTEAGETGHAAIVGKILSSSSEAVTRELLANTGIAKNAQVAWNTNLYVGKLSTDLGLEIRDVAIAGPLGNLPAWYIPGKLPVWVVLVHGATATRTQTLRAAKTLADLGLSLLVVSYRDDEGAPRSPGGLSCLGAAEWEDLEACVRYAREQGAQRVLLYGWSLGGMINLVFLQRSSYANQIQGVILDSPILDWRSTLGALLKKNKLPVFFSPIVEQIVALRTGVAFADLNQLAQPAPTIPVLLFHGTGDTTVPVAISDAFAARSSVTYQRIEHAEHTQCWNTDAPTYEAALRTFLAHVIDGVPTQ